MATAQAGRTRRAWVRRWETSFKHADAGESWSDQDALELRGKLIGDPQTKQTQ